MFFYHVSSISEVECLINFWGGSPLGIPRDILGEIPRDPSGSLGGRWGATLPIFLILKIVILQVVVHPPPGIPREIPRDPQARQRLCPSDGPGPYTSEARLAQSAERKALNLVVVGSSPTVGVLSAPPGAPLR